MYFQSQPSRGPLVRPDRRVIASPKIDNLIDIHSVGDQGRRRGDGRTLAILGKCRLWLDGKIQRFDAGAVEPATVGCGAGPAGWQVGPVGRMKSMEDRIRADPDRRQPLAPLRKSSR